MTDRPVVITDSDISAQLTAGAAVAWMREAVIAAENGQLRAPARVWSDLGEGRLVFTAGSLAGQWFGYRSYDTLGSDPGEQVVLVHEAGTGRVRGIAVGNLLGQLRTGALGGVAAGALAHPAASTVAVIGSGRQAWAQLWAIAAVRDLERVDVYSATPAHARAFAARAGGELGVPCFTAPSAELATREHAIVVLATSSPVPVIDSRWVAPGAHVTTVGRKQQGAAEFGLDLVERADAIATDSLPQLAGYDPPTLVSASRHHNRVLSLGAVLTGAGPASRPARGVTLYLSVGLAGTEVYLLERLLASGPPAQR